MYEIWEIFKVLWGDTDLPLIDKNKKKNKTEYVPTPTIIKYLLCNAPFKNTQ